MKKFAYLVFRISCLVLLAGCVLQTKHRGFIFPDDLEAQLAATKTKGELERKFGSPQARTVFGDTVWIYYRVDENYRGPLPLTYDNKKVLLVWSDKDGKITNTKVLGDEDLPDIWFARGETPIPAAIELNALEELVNNIGRFTPAGLGQ